MHVFSSPSRLRYFFVAKTVIVPAVSFGMMGVYIFKLPHTSDMSNSIFINRLSGAQGWRWRTSDFTEVNIIRKCVHISLAPLFCRHTGMSLPMLIGHLMTLTGKLGNACMQFSGLYKVFEGYPFSTYSASSYPGLWALHYCVSLLVSRILSGSYTYMQVRDCGSECEPSCLWRSPLESF